MIFCILATFIISSSMVPVHECISRVKIESRDDAGILLGNVPQNFNEQDYISTTAAITQAEFMLSGIVIEKVIDQMNLTKRPTIINSILETLHVGGQYTPERLRADDFADTGIINAFLQRRSVMAEVVENTDIVDIYAYSDDPEEAKQIANAVAKTYLQVNVQLRELSGNVALKSLEERRAHAEKRLHEAEAALHNFQEEQGFVDLGMQNQALVDKLSDLEKTLDTVNQQIDVAQGVIRATDSGISGSGRYDLFSSMEQVNPMILTLKSQKSALTAELSALLATDYTQNHPRIIEQKQKIRDIQGQIDEETRKTFSSELSRLNTQKEQLLREIRKQQEIMKAWPLTQVRFAELMRAVNLAETRFSTLDAQIPIAVLAAATPMPTAVIVQEAVFPDLKDPYYPNPVLYAIIAMFVSVVLGIGFVFLVEYMDDSIKRSEDAERDLGIPVIGRIPCKRSVGKLDFEHISQTHSSLFEAYLDCSQKLQRLLADEVKSFLIISSSPCEGKSSIAAYLGLCLAQDGRRVALVDFNPYNPTLHKRFELPPAAGISEFLENTALTVKEVTVPTKINGLHVIPAGTRPADLSRGVYSPRVKELIETLNQSYDVVLVDGPAIAKFRGITALTSLFEKALVAISLRSTSKTRALATLRLLASNKTEVVGIVATREKRSCIPVS